MFIVQDNPRFTHTVTAMVPVDGGHERQDFKVTFQAMETDEIGKLDLADAAASTEFLRRVVVGLGDIAGADGKPLTYSDKVRDQVIGMLWARRAIVAGYFKAVNAAAEGN